MSAPERIWDFWPHDGGSPICWREPCPFPAEDADVFEYIRADLAHTDADLHRAVRAALVAAENICDEERHNLNALTSSPPQSAAAVAARNRIRAIDPAAILDKLKEENTE